MFLDPMETSAVSANGKIYAKLQEVSV